MTESCLDLAKKSAKGRLTDQEILDAFDREQKIREYFIETGRSDNIDSRVANAIVNEAAAKKIEQARQKRALAQNIIVRERLNGQIAEFLSDGMSRRNALLALGEGSQMGIKKARVSMDYKQQSYEASYIGDTFSYIEQERPQIMNLLDDKTFDNAVNDELFELREGGNPGSTGNSDAQWLAKVLAGAMELSRTDLNRMGAAIGHIDGYAGPQSHDDLAMLAVTAQVWKDKFKPLIDLGRSFPDANEAEIDGIFLDAYNTIITGGVGADSPALRGQRVSPSGMAKRLGAHRVFHFKDAASARAYRDEFGRGSTIQGIFSQLRHHAKIAGAMDQFGENPPMMFKSLVARQQQELVKEIAGLTGKAKTKALAELKSIDIERLNSTLEETQFLATRPVNINTALINNNIRSAQSMAKLGGATATAIPTDTVTAALAAMYRGQGFWKGFGRFIAEMGNRKDGKQISYLLGEGFDTAIGHIASAVLNENPMAGRMSRLTHSFFKWNGLSGWTDTARAIAARVTSAHMGGEVGKAFGQLHPKFRHVLEMNGITAEKWNAIRSLSYREINGNIYVTPDRIRGLDDAAIEPIVADKIAEARAAIKLNKAGEITPSQQTRFDLRRAKIIKQGRLDLEINLRGYFADEARYAIVETDMASRRFTRMGTRPGTVPGEVVRYIMQFKSFPVAFSNRILGRAIKGGIGRTASHRLLNNAPHIGIMMAGLAVAGYASIVVKDTMRGVWPPRDPLSLRTIGSALLQGGTFGIYGDFLFGRLSRYGQGPVETLSGPGVGAAADLYNLWQDAMNGNPRAGSYLDLAVNNTPYVNLIYSRPVLDFLFLNALREAMSPGYLGRQERRLEDERGQRYFVPRTVQEALQ